DRSRPRHRVRVALASRIDGRNDPADSRGRCRTVTLVIRRARQADLPTLGKLGALLVRAHHDFDPKRFMAAAPRTEAGYAGFLGTQLASPDAAVFVADQDGDVIGYTYAGVEGHDWMSLRGPAGVLHDLVVDPLHRRNGVGRALLIETLEFLK